MPNLSWIIFRETTSHNGIIYPLKALTPLKPTTSRLAGIQGTCKQTTKLEIHKTIRRDCTAELAIV